MADAGRQPPPSHADLRLFDAGQARRLVWLLALSYAVSFVDRALLAVTAAPVKLEFGLSDTRFGALHGLAYVALFCLCGLPFGWLADRSDRRRILAGGLAFWSLMTAWCGLTASFSGFFVARIGVGLGEACLVPVAMSLFGSAIARSEMSKAVALFLVGATLGNSLALVGGGELLAWLGHAKPLPAWLSATLAPWRVLYLVAALPGFAVAALVMTLHEPPRPVAAAARSPRDDLRAMAAQWRTRRSAYAWLTAATACSVTLAQAQAAWMPLFFMRRFAMTPGDSAACVGLLFLLTAPTGQWVGGRAIHALQRRGVGAPSSKLLALTALLSLPLAACFCLSDRFGVAQVAYAAFNFIVFAATPAGLTGWQLLTPERVRGSLIAVLVSVVTLVGVGVGPGVVGLLTDRVFHDGQAINLSLLAVIAVAAVGCALFAWLGQASYARAVAGPDAVDAVDAMHAMHAKDAKDAMPRCSLERSAEGALTLAAGAASCPDFHPPRA